MADEGYDPCECICTYEMAMRRLITLLRQSQSYCTDTECWNELPGPSSNDGNSDNVLLMVVCTILAFALFFLRPSFLRFNGDSKPRNNNQDSFPPAPPSMN
ncbi:small integral membrane protein 14 [Oratosquilla oratoria]|uniref:small integral membrane protein 14 n=1 Tax=Oratosquilla oratoria TaxID=337810 RepID=UPI003F76A26F